MSGLLTMGSGALLFIPAASVPSFPLFLTALIVLAAGITALQVAANPYVAVLGPPETASSRLNLTQAFNSLGTTIAPYLGQPVNPEHRPAGHRAGARIPPARLQAYRLQQASSVKLPYLGLALALIALALLIAKFKLPRYINGAIPAGERWSGFRLEAAPPFAGGDWNICLRGRGSFDRQLPGELHEPAIHRQYSRADRRALRVVLLGRRDGGRFIGSGLLQKVRTGTLLGIVAIVAGSLVTVSMLTVGHIAMWSILLVGLFNSIMFPSIFTLGIDGLGPLTGKGSGVLVCAIVGGAIIPELQGIVADHIGIHHAFFLPVICYLYITYFAFWGSRRLGPAKKLN